MKYTDKAAALVLSGVLALSMSPVAFAADATSTAGHDSSATSATASTETDGVAATVEANENVTLADGKYSIPVSSDFGMFGLDGTATVIVNGSEATVTVTSDSEVDGSGAPKYDAIWLGRRSAAPDVSKAKLVEGAPVYAGKNYTGENTWKDSTGRIVDKYRFTFAVSLGQLNTGVYYVARYTGHYKNSSGSTARAGQWSGELDHSITFDLANAKQKAVKSFTVNKATVSAAAVRAAAKKVGATTSSATSITLGAKVKVISKKAFAKYKKAKTLFVKSTKLTKKSVKNALEGSKVKTVKVKVSSKKATDKRYVKKYRKIFTKANAGKKVTVK